LLFAKFLFPLHHNKAIHSFYWYQSSFSRSIRLLLYS